MRRILSDEALDTLFRNPCNAPAWLDRPVGDMLLRALWELAKLGPIPGQSAPELILFVRSPAAKDQLLLALPPQEGTFMQAAPVTAILADGTEGATPIGRSVSGAARQASLRAAYLMLAARALGLDCYPMWNFVPAAVESAFFPEGGVAATHLCSLGYGEDARADPDPPRRGPDESCRIL
jgi:3-hydroxypropanoate dehydrogenase